MSPSINQQSRDLQVTLHRSVEGLRTLAALLEINGDNGGQCLQSPSDFNIGLSALLNLVADSLHAQYQPLEALEVASRTMPTQEVHHA